MSQSATPRTTSRRVLSAALLCGGLILAGAGAVRAQGFAGTFFDDDVLPPRVVAWRLAERGFTGLSRPRFDGRVYVVEAVNPVGAPVRLLVDPATGAIIGRERLGAAETYARLERPPLRRMPGYGWTEDDAVPARPLPSEPGPAARIPRQPGFEAARPTEANPYGLNPDGPHRPEAPRKLSRTPPLRPADKAATRISPEAPAPKAGAEAPRSRPKPAATAALPAAEPAKAATPDAAKPDAVKPEAPKPAAAEPVKTPAANSAASEGARAEAAPKADWKDPPADGKRPVRVIGGATIVPGTPDKDGETSQP